MTILEAIEHGLLIICAILYIVSTIFNTYY
jgi:hypothetical protein